MGCGSQKPTANSISVVPAVQTINPTPQVTPANQQTVTTPNDIPEITKPVEKHDAKKLKGVHACYQLGEPVHKTMCGFVYEAVKDDTKEKRNVRAFLKSTIEDVGQMKKEFDVIKEINHPNIVKTFELFDDNGDEFIYVTSQLSKGISLFDLMLREKGIEFERIIKIIHGVIDAIKVFHGKDIIYKKICPSNIILEGEAGKEVPMLSSITMSRFAKPSYSHSESPIYDAPEVHKSGRFSRKSDMWSVGMLGFLLLTGEIPYQFAKGANLPDIMMSKPIVEQDIRKYKLKNESIEFLAKCLDMNEEYRPKADDALKMDFINKIESAKEKVDYGAGMKNFQKSNRIEKELFRFIYYNNQIGKTETKLIQLFQEADKTHDGKVSRYEFIETIKNKDFGLPMSYVELSKAFDEADRDKSGNLSYHEFLTMFFDKQKALTVDNIKKAFNEMDKDKSGTLTKEDFAGIKDIEHVISEIDKSKDGKITLDELVTYVTKKMKPFDPKMTEAKKA